jgi:amino-acid N-acetyltransferase
MGGEMRSAPSAPFSEKGFYLSEFRGRTLAFGLRAEDLRAPAPLEAVLKELEANPTRVVLVSTERAALEGVLATEVLPGGGGGTGLEAAVWRGLRRSGRVGLAVDPGRRFAPACREIALRLGVSKWVWVDREGGLRAGDGSRQSFVDLEQLRCLLAGALPGPSADRRGLLREVEAALTGGLPAVNLCTLEGLADELFTYAGAGTLFTRERYVLVRRLAIDDYDAAADLIGRGVEEGYLAPRMPEEIERILAHGFGAFVEGRYLAGIGALLIHEPSGAGEIASVYTLTRFLGEGVGSHLVGHALERARSSGCGFVFACTTSERVQRFFESHGFRRVEPEAIPPEKWRRYDAARRSRLRCLRTDLA